MYLNIQGICVSFSLKFPASPNDFSHSEQVWVFSPLRVNKGCIFRLTCSYPELTEDHVLTSAYVKIFRTVTRNAVNKSV